MFYVYILLSRKDNKFYVGYTADLKLRYKEHQDGGVKSTKFRRPLKLIYYEAYMNQANAQKREQFYKSGRGRETLQKILKETLQELGGLS